MATSGTVATTTVNIAQLAEHAHRRCGVLPGKITSEMMDAFVRNLFVKTSAWSARGELLWTIDRQMLGVYPNQVQYSLPAGTVDIMDVQYRTQTNQTFGATASSSAGGTASNAINLSSALSSYCTQTSANGNIAVTLPSAVQISTVGFNAGPGITATHLIFEYSTNGSTWATAYDPGVVTQVAGQWVWYDLLSAAYTAQYWRVRETGGGIIVCAQFCLQNTPNEIPMSQLNRDDYDNLPNKFFTSTRSLQYYKDRLLNNPVLNIWPISTSVFDQIVVRRHRQMMDPGTMVNQMEVPQRWLDALQTGAVAWTADELFGNPAAPMVNAEMIAMRYGQYKEALENVEDDETDGGPIFFAPSIAVYTR